VINKNTSSERYNDLRLDSISSLICNKIWRNDYRFHPYRRKKDKYYAILNEYIHKDSSTHSDPRHRLFLIYDSCNINRMYIKTSFDYISESEYIISDTLIQRYQSNWNLTIIDSSVYIYDYKYKQEDKYKEILFINDETIILASDSTVFSVYTNNKIPFNQSRIEKDDYFIVPIIKKYYKDKDLEFRVLDY